MIYQKIQEIDEDIAYVELMEIICQDIENNKYKEENDVFKTTNKKRQLLKNKIYTNYNKIIHNGEFQKSLKNSNLFCMCCQKSLSKRQLFFYLFAKLIILFQKLL